jgi:hypothetical protein
MGEYARIGGRGPHGVSRAERLRRHGGRFRVPRGPSVGFADTSPSQSDGEDEMRQP